MAEPIEWRISMAASHRGPPSIAALVEAEWATMTNFDGAGKASSEEPGEHQHIEAG